MQDKHHGRRTTWASLAITQKPAAPLHLQHACMIPSRSRNWLPASPASVSPSCAALVPRAAAPMQYLHDLGAPPTKPTDIDLANDTELTFAMAVRTAWGTGWSARF